MRTAHTYVRTYLTVNGEFIIWEQTIGLLKEEISSDELLEAPVLPLYKLVGTLTLWNKLVRMIR